MRKHLSVVLNDLCISNKKRQEPLFFWILAIGYGTLRYGIWDMGRFAMGYGIWDASLLGIGRPAGYWVWGIGYGLLVGLEAGGKDEFGFGIVAHSNQIIIITIIKFVFFANLIGRKRVVAREDTIFGFSI